MKEKNNIPIPKHIPPPTTWLIKLGEKYYRRMQPTPYVFIKIKLPKIK